MAADNTRKTSNVIHDLATLKTQVENNTNNIANATSPNDGKINLSVGTGLSLADGSANASANQAGNTSWTVNLDPENITLNQYLKNVDGVGPNATGGVDLKSTDSSLNITPDATNNSIDLTLNGTIPTVNDKTIGLVQGTGINISGANATTNMAANSSQCISLNANISDLNDVNTSGASLNQALVFNGTQWLPGTVSGSGDGTVKSVDGVGPNTTTGDIDLSSPSGSLTITPDTANHTVQLELNGTIPTVNDGKINMTASNGVKMSSDSQNASANQSGNTTFKIEADTDSLNSTLNFAKTTDIGNGSIGIIEGTGINVTGSNATANQSTNSNWTINLNANLSQLNDVSDTTASNNQVLTYDNGTWKPAASQTGGVTELSALNDTNVANPETGEILVYDKSTGKWNNQSPGENTAELPISSSDETVKLSDDTTGGQTSNFIVETGTDVFKLVANANVFGTGTNPNGGPEVISIVGDGWGGIIVGDSVTGNRIPDGTVVVSKDESNDRVTLSQATTGDTLSTEELTFSHPAPESAQFQERMRINGIGQITAETPDYDDNVEAKSLVTKAWVEANGGSGGVSNLPISSSDNKVTLSDDGNGKFQIETGDPTTDPSSKAVRVEVDDTTVTNRVDQVLQINKNATTAPSNANNVNNNQMMTLKSTDESGAKFIGLSFQHVLSGGMGASACIGLQDESADGVPNKGEMQFVIRGDDSAQVATPLRMNKDAIIVSHKLGVDIDPVYSLHVKDSANVEFFYSGGFAYSVIQTDRGVTGTQRRDTPGICLQNNKGESGNVGIWTILVESGQGKNNSLSFLNSGASGVGTDPRFEFTAGDSNNLIIHTGRLQTDTITTKEGTTDDLSLHLKGNGTGKKGSLGVNVDPRANVLIDAEFHEQFYGVYETVEPYTRVAKVDDDGNYSPDGTNQTIQLVSGVRYETKSIETNQKRTVEFFINPDPNWGYGWGDAFSGGGTPTQTTKGYRLWVAWDTGDIRVPDDYSPTSEHALVTKGWVTENTATGNFLPLAGGEFDSGVNVLQPSGNSVQPNLQVGGVAGETPRPSFTVAAKSSISPDPNVQMVAWCAAETNNYYTGSAYLKFAHGQEDTDNDDAPDAPMSYWNVLAIPPQRQTVPELILNEAYDPDEAESNPDYNVPEYIESGVQLYDRTDYQLQIGGVVKPYDSADGNGTGNQPFVQWVMSTSIDERRTIYNVPVNIVDTKGLYARNLQTMEGVDTDTRINLYKDNIRVMPQQPYPGYNLASNNDYAFDIRMPNAKMRIRNDYGNLDTGDGPNDGSTSFRLDTGWNTATTRIELCSGGGLRGELRNEGTSGLFLQSQYATSFVSGNRQAGYHNAGHWYMGDGPNPGKLSGFQSSAVTVKVESDQNRGGTGGYTGVQSAPSMPPAAKGNLISFSAASYYVNDDTTNVFSYNADRPVGNLDNVRVDNQSQITVGTYCGFRVGNPVKSKAGQNIGLYTGIYENTLPARGFFGQYETVQIPNPDYIDEDTTPGVPPTVDEVNEILPPDPDYPADIQVNFKEGIPSPDDLPTLQYGSDMTVGHPVNGDAYVLTEGDYTNRCYCLTGWDADVEDSGEWLIGKVEGFAYNNYAIYCDGPAPSRFNGDIQLPAQAAITGTAPDTDTRLYIASGYLNLQIEKGSTGSVLAIRRLQGETTANAWTKYVSKKDDGTIENGWFGYEFDAKRYRFLESGGGYSAFAFDVSDTNQIAMRVPNGDTGNPPMLHVSASTDSNTPKYSRSFKDIANASMPDGWSPASNNQLATKEYTDSRIWKGTQSEYDALSSYDDEILYCITG